MRVSISDYTKKSKVNNLFASHTEKKIIFSNLEWLHFNVDICLSYQVFEIFATREWRLNKLITGKRLLENSDFQFYLQIYFNKSVEVCTQEHPYA